MTEKIEEEKKIKQVKPVKQEEIYYDVKTLLAWSAPGRPFRKKSREFYLSIVLITFLLEIILFLFSQYELMATVIAIVFLSIVLSTIPPRNFNYKISTEGITVEDHFYLWDELYDFYFKKVDGVDILFVRSHLFIPGELKIPLGDFNKDHVRQTLLNFLPYREIVRSTFVEKAADWLEKTFPLEKAS